MPEKFDLNYIDEKNEKKRPVVIHRAVLGSLDRFLAILIEHFRCIPGIGGASSSEGHSSFECSPCTIRR